MQVFATLALLSSATLSVAQYAYRQPPQGIVLYASRPIYPTGTGAAGAAYATGTGGAGNAAGAGGLYPNVTLTTTTVCPSSSVPGSAITNGAGSGAGNGAGSGANGGSGNGGGAGTNSFNSNSSSPNSNSAPEPYTGGSPVAHSIPSGLTPYLTTIAGLAIFAVYA